MVNVLGNPIHITPTSRIQQDPSTLAWDLGKKPLRLSGMHHDGSHPDLRESSFSRQDAVTEKARFLGPDR